MLILTRKVGETIILAGKVRVQVLELKGSQVRIGITAPDDIRIRREAPSKKEPVSHGAENLEPRMDANEHE